MKMKCEITIEKECRKCKAMKPLQDYYKRRATKDGYAYWCKECKIKHNNILSEKSKRPKDNFLEVATEWNKKHPVIRSNDYEARVSILKGDTERTCVI